MCRDDAMAIQDAMASITLLWPALLCHGQHFIATHIRAHLHHTSIRLQDALPKVCGGKPVTVGGYAYLDGELHVRVNLACDAIMQVSCAPPLPGPAPRPPPVCVRE